MQTERCNVVVVGHSARRRGTYGLRCLVSHVLLQKYAEFPQVKLFLARYEELSQSVEVCLCCVPIACPPGPRPVACILCLVPCTALCPVPGPMPRAQSQFVGMGTLYCVNVQQLVPTVFGSCLPSPFSLDTAWVACSRVSAAKALWEVWARSCWWSALVLVHVVCLTGCVVWGMRGFRLG